MEKEQNSKTEENISKQKKSPENSENNKIGKRIVVGESAIVASDRKKYDNTDAIFHDQSKNPWSNSSLLPEEELVLLKKKLESIK